MPSSTRRGGCFTRRGGCRCSQSTSRKSSGQLWLALILVAIAALVLGMGLPATAAYIVLSVMTGPALQELGLALITAHMIIFWLSQTSNVTPPIALAAFAGAGVAGAPPMRSAIEAFKLANGLFVIPLMMAYTPLLLADGNTWFDVLFAGLVALAMVVTIAMLSERFLFVALGKSGFALGFIAIICLLVPYDLVRIAGVTLAGGLVLSNWFSATKSDGGIAS